MRASRMKMIPRRGPLGSRHRLSAARLALVFLLAPSPLRGQGALVDQGSFRILVGAREVGLETFSIRRSGTGEDLRYAADSDIRADLPEGRLELVTTLATQGSALTPSGYQAKRSGDQEGQLTYRVRGNRLVLRLNSPRGEELREFRYQEGVVILESGVSHHFHFLVAQYLLGNTRVPVLSPRERLFFEVELEERETSTLRIGTSSRAARRLRVSGDSLQWEVWFDSEGRVLRVEQPLRGFRAERVEMPG